MRPIGLLAEELLDELAVGGREDLVLVEAALAVARLDLEVVAHAGLLLHDLAGTGDLEALLRPRMGLLLRHCFLLSLLVHSPCWRRALRWPRPWPPTCSSPGR